VPTEEKKKEMKGKKPTRVTVHRIVNGKKIPFYVLDDASKFRLADWYVNGLLGGLLRLHFHGNSAPCIMLLVPDDRLL
jgi:hypothetical protein